LLVVHQRPTHCSWDTSHATLCGVNLTWQTANQKTPKGQVPFVMFYIFQ
jgi:hypothetical protein